jgi:hypothetical protein
MFQFFSHYFCLNFLFLIQFLYMNLEWTCEALNKNACKFTFEIEGFAARL